MRRSMLGLLALSLAACGPKKPSLPLPTPGLSDPDAVVAAFRAAPALEALRVRARLRVETPDRSVSTPASLVLGGPDRLRVDVLTPLGTPFAVLATDGTALNVWIQRSSTFLRGDNALEVLGEATGDVLETSDLLAVLTGRLPVPDARVERATATALGGVELVLAKDSAPAYRLVAQLDPAARLVRALRLHEAPPGASTELGPARVAVRYPGARATDNAGWRPEAVVVELPDLGWTVTLDITSWEPLSEAPDVFALAPPKGAQEQDLVTVLRQMAASRASAAQAD